MNELGNILALGIALFGAVEFTSELTQYLIRRRKEDFQRQLDLRHRKDR